VTSRFPDRCFAFDQFGPLSIRPYHGTGWAPKTSPDRLPATYRRTHGIRYLHGCYSLGDDQLWGVMRRRQGGDHTLAAFRSIRAARPDGAPIYIICDKPVGQHHAGDPGLGRPQQGRAGADPDQRLQGQPDPEAQFGPLRSFTLADSNYPTTPCWPATCRCTYVGATPTPATPTSSPPSVVYAPASAANANNAGGATHDEASRLTSVRRLEVSRVVQPAANRAVVTVLNHAVRVVPLMITAVDRPLAGNTPVDQEPRKASPKPRPPSVPTTAGVAHQQNLRPVGPIHTSNINLVNVHGQRTRLPLTCWACERSSRRLI
jgi:hypothetical protein